VWGRGYVLREPRGDKEICLRFQGTFGLSPIRQCSSSVRNALSHTRLKRPRWGQRAARFVACAAATLSSSGTPPGCRLLHKLIGSRSKRLAPPHPSHSLPIRPTKLRYM
jgi:hypothetical protein